MKLTDTELAGLKSLLNKIEFIKPVWIMKVEKNILKTVISCHIKTNFKRKEWIELFKKEKII